MATHSSVLAQRIPGTGEPGGPPSMGLHRVGHDGSDLAAGCKTQPKNLCPLLLLYGNKGSVCAHRPVMRQVSAKSGTSISNKGAV